MCRIWASRMCNEWKFLRLEPGHLHFKWSKPYVSENAKVWWTTDKAVGEREITGGVLCSLRCLDSGRAIAGQIWIFCKITLNSVEEECKGCAGGWHLVWWEWFLQGDKCPEGKHSWTKTESGSRREKGRNRSDAKHGESLECSERWAVYRGNGLLVDMKWLIGTHWVSKALLLAEETFQGWVSCLHPLWIPQRKAERETAWLGDSTWREQGEHHLFHYNPPSAWHL